MNFYFDTNFYRQIAHNKSISNLRKIILGLVKHQKIKTIDSFAHIYVLVELLSHLHSPTDPAFIDCRNAIIALWNHCLNTQDGKFKYITDYDSFFADFLFRKKIDGAFEFYDSCVQLAAYINKNDSDYELFNIRDDLNGIHEAVKELEIQFVDRYKNFIQYTDPNAENWQLYKNNREFRERNLKFLSSNDAIELISRLEVKKIARYARQEISKEEINKYAKILIENFRLHITIQINILKKIIISGCDFSKNNRSNWFWDMNIAACVQTSNFNNPERFSLVTSDKDILNAANECGYRNRVMNFDEYFQFLKN